MLEAEKKNAINFHEGSMRKVVLNDYDFVPYGNFFMHFINSGHDVEKRIFCTKGFERLRTSENVHYQK